MKKEKDLAKYQLYTDLAIEKILNKKRKNLYQEIDDEGLKVLTNLDDSPNKFFISIEFEDITDSDNQKIVTKVFATYLKKLIKKLKIKNTDKCLVIGLGNQKSTPDSLGPNVIEKIIVTAHLFNLNDFIVDKNYRNVSAFAPNVTSATGLETYKHIETIVKNFKPDFLIVIDSLIAKSFSRLNRVIQLTNRGITPGSGLGSFQKEITPESLGIPVIAIGVPTVVEAEIIVNETINYIIENSTDNKNLKHLESMSEDEVKIILDKILSPINNLMVTPKEIDFVIKKLSEIIAEGINKTLHKKIS